MEGEAGVGLGWRSGSCGAKQRPLRPIQCVCGRAQALRAHLAMGASVAGGEVGGGANRVCGEAEEVGRHAGGVGGCLELRGGTASVQTVL